MPTKSVKSAVEIIRDARKAGWKVSVSPTRLSEGKVPLFTMVALFWQSPQAFGAAKQIIFMFRRRNRTVTVATQSRRIYSNGAGKKSAGLWSAGYLLTHS